MVLADGKAWLEGVASIVAALSKHSFGVGDRLALLLPNKHEYIELVYACAWPNRAQISVTSVADEADLIQKGEPLTMPRVVPSQMTVSLRCAT